MSTSLASPVAVSAEATRAPTPTFFGIVRGELFKVSRQRATVVMALLLVAILAVPYLFILNSSYVKTLVLHAPLTAAYATMGATLMILRVFSGLFLVVITARLLGMEYSGGTIRVLLSRGVGRVQLLSAKLLTVAVIGLAILAVGLVINTILTVLVTGAIAGNLDPLKALNAGFWEDTRAYVLTIAFNMAVTILMAAAVTVLTRSLAGGLALGLGWFPADNIGVLFFLLGYKMTNSTFWTQATGDLLGPNLNAMAPAVLPARAAVAAEAATTTSPLVPVSGGHTLLIAAIYAAIFAIVAFGLTAWRDVTE